MKILTKKVVKNSYKKLDEEIHAASILDDFVLNALSDSYIQNLALSSQILKNCRSGSF